MSEQTKHNIIEYVINLLSASGGQSALSKAETAACLETAYEIQNFLNEIPGGFLIYYADGDEEILYANAALLRIFGCETLREFKEYTNNSFKGLVHPDDVDQVEASIKEQIFDSQFDLDYVEYRIIRKDGAVRWIEDYGHYIKNSGLGNIFYVFITDVTDKKQRELSEKAELIRQNAESEQKIKTLVEEYDRERQLINREHLRRLEVIEGLSVNYDTILYVDLDADTVLPYRQGNRVYRQFNGEFRARKFDWYIADYVENIVCPDDRERILGILQPDYMRKKLSEIKTYYANYRGGVNGETQYLQIRMVNVGSSERVSQVVIGYRNVDEEVRHEMQQLQALENALRTAKQADVAKNTFLSNMSHDLRTPLNAIFGYTALAKSHADDGKAVVAYLDKIDVAGKQILELINKVLELSYIEANELKVNESDCDVYDIAEEIRDFTLERAARKNISCALHCDNISHRNVYADASKLEQALQYIAGNAVKYTDNGGKVDIAVTETGHAGEFATFRFTVADTGIGMEKRELKHIFSPFARLQDTTSSGVYGTGLGLTIAKNIIEMMGGTIDVQSELGKGSTFTVTVRLRVQSAPPRAAKYNANNALDAVNDKKILVVEDNEINLEIITEILEGLGIAVDTAVNGKLAVDKIKASSPDDYALVLMDIQMPVMDGRQATEEIRKLDDRRLADIPIVALSANAFESDKRLSMEAGMDAHLTKPLDVQLLLQTFADILNER